MIGFCSSARFADHPTGPRHPERPDRIRAVHRAVRQAKLLTTTDPFPDFALDLGRLEPAGFELIDLGEPLPDMIDDLQLVHPAVMIDRVRHICELGGGVLDQGDTCVGAESFQIAQTAVGAWLRCCDAAVDGRVQRAFAAVRPPGHHAEPDRAMGFCLFSNIAVAARHLQRRRKIGKIAIVDFDVHHGNGTQAAFEDDPTVLFISLHQHPRTCYPGSGYEWETGQGAGEGFTLNIPFPPGAGDESYLEAFDAKVLPALDRFRPEFLLISAGFDAHRDDPLAQIELSEACYEAMTRRLVEVAERHCGGRIVSGLEGGYNLRALGRCVVRHLIGLRGGSPGGFSS